MNRRAFLAALGSLAFGAATGAWPCGAAVQGKTPLPQAPQPRPVPGGDGVPAELPAIPIMLFHRVDEDPHSPDGITSAQLMRLLEYAWEQGYHPVNMSDILLHRVDEIVPQGLMPLGITVDDAHRSVIFSRKTTMHQDQRNERSFMEILGDSTARRNLPARATLFLSGTNARRTGPDGGYFGSQMPLVGVLDALGVMPGVEAAYHTRRHPRMRTMGYEATKAVLQDQMEQFHGLGVLDRIVRILAYPYGQRPEDPGLQALRELGFLGGVLAYPGVREGHCKEVPLCYYDGRLLNDPFLVPRVTIGAMTYAFGPITTGGRFRDIDPVEDFRKDVQGIPRAYRSRGPAGTVGPEAAPEPAALS